MTEKFAICDSPAPARSAYPDGFDDVAIEVGAGIRRPLRGRRGNVQSSTRFRSCRRNGASSPKKLAIIARRKLAGSNRESSRGWPACAASTAVKVNWVRPLPSRNGWIAFRYARNAATSSAKAVASLPLRKSAPRNGRIALASQQGCSRENKKGFDPWSSGRFDSVPLSRRHPGRGADVPRNSARRKSGRQAAALQPVRQR